MNLSTDPEVEQLTAGFDIPNVEVLKLKNIINQGPCITMAVGAEVLSVLGIQYTIFLGSDCIVAPDWVFKLKELHNRFPGTIISGFNTEAHKSERRNEDEGYLVKRTAGSVGYFFDMFGYQNVILPSIKKTTTLRLGSR